MHINSTYLHACLHKPLTPKVDKDMKRSFVTLLFVVVMAIGGIGMAKAQVVEHDGVITLTFEGLGHSVEIGDFYNGGAGGDYGIYFYNRLVAIFDRYTEGGNSAIYGEPSPVAVLAFYPETGNYSAQMDIFSGFTEGLSFYYNSNGRALSPLSVIVYSGLNGTGNILAQVELLNITSPNYIPFTPFGIEFEGTAHSVVFSGYVTYFNLDNLTFGSSIPYPDPNPTPEPGTIVLMGAGILGMLGMRRRFKK